MSSEIRHAAIREIEKAGGTVRCSIRNGESVVIVTDPKGPMVKVKNAFSFDLEQALILYRGAKGKKVKPPKAAKAVERPRARLKARTRVVASPAATATHTSENLAPETDVPGRPFLKERLKLRNQERMAS